MYLSLTIVVCLQIISSGSSISLPKYIVPCSRTDPNFKRCALEHGTAALPKLLKGDRQYNIPSLDPLVLPFFQIRASTTLSLNSTNLEIRGLEKTKLIDYNTDFDKLEHSMTINVEQMHLEGNSTSDGEILSLPIRGSGLSTIILENGNYTYSSKWKLIRKKDGRDYAQVLSERIDFEIENIHFNIGQSFFGNSEVLATAINSFLNENWKEILEEVRLPISETIATLCRNVAGNLIENVPFDELYLK